jgi:general stress protein 26
MSTDASSLTTEDLEFLRRPLQGLLSVAAGPIPAQPRPVWFEATDEGAVQLFTGPDTLKVRRLRRDPRASIVVAAPVGERERWVSIAGTVTVELGGAHDLAARYWTSTTRPAPPTWPESWPRTRSAWSSTRKP